MLGLYAGVVQTCQQVELQSAKAEGGLGFLLYDKVHDFSVRDEGLEGEAAPGSLFSWACLPVCRELPQRHSRWQAGAQVTGLISLMAVCS